MTAGEMIALADRLRPNQYTTADKLRWLERLDGQVLSEVIGTHAEIAPDCACPAAPRTANSSAPKTSAPTATPSSPRAARAPSPPRSPTPAGSSRRTPSAMSRTARSTSPARPRP